MKCLHLCTLCGYVCRFVLSAAIESYWAEALLDPRFTKPNRTVDDLKSQNIVII